MSAAAKYSTESKHLHTPRHGINMPFETPSRPWNGVTMDFVTDLPESMASGYTGILIIVD